MVKLNVNLSSIVIGFLLGVSLMLLVGAKEYDTPHYQMKVTSSSDRGPSCWVIDTHKGMVWMYTGGSWNAGVSLPETVSK